jgi:hypothetical protein
MKGWGISRWQALVLACVLVAIALIVVIPDEWDLPDTAFQGGTAPIVMHLRTGSGTVLLSINVPVKFWISPDTRRTGGDSSPLSAPPTSLSVLVSLRC